MGYFMPAEWEPHEATWLAWPHKEASWPGNFAPIPAIWAQMAKQLSKGERVHILVRDAAMEAEARRVLRANDATSPDIHLHHVPTNDSWIRDAGPIFLKNRDAKKPPLILDWIYNSWGNKYPPYDLDDAIPQRIAETLGLEFVQPGIVIEGGSIDVNGAGLLLTSEQCLLNKNRNPHLSREQIEQYLRDFIGARKIIWLGQGIEGDDTDGHVDDLTRFVSADTVVTVVEENRNDENYELLQENLERLKGATDLGGKSLKIIELPMPKPTIYEDTRLPASYANFYIANAVVLVPTFDCPDRDERACAILSDCFPGREIVPIRSTELVWGLGAFHCVTQQQPKI